MSMFTIVRATLFSYPKSCSQPQLPVLADTWSDITFELTCSSFQVSELISSSLPSPPIAIIMQPAANSHQRATAGATASHVKDGKLWFYPETVV